MAADEARDPSLLIHEVLAEAWSRTALRDALQLIAEGVTQVTGFGVAAVSVLRDSNEFEVIAVAGNDECRAELMGNFTPRGDIEAELGVAEDWGLLKFVPHELLPGDVTLGWVPDMQPLDVANAWHPLDLLVAPLLDHAGHIRGLLAVDLPDDGRRPDADRRRLLEAYVVQASKTLVAAVEREQLVEQVRLASAARAIVRRASAQLNLDRIIEECRAAIVEGFRTRGMWIQTFDERNEVHGEMYSQEGGTLDIPADLRRLLREASERCWTEQRVAVLSRRRRTRVVIGDAERERALQFLDSIGMASVLLVPLGAGSECLGAILLARGPADPEWSDVESSAALDIGHDLGRAVLNARLFERDRQLVNELKELDSYRNRLISTVSHELKNPITTLVGHLEILSATPLPSTARRSIAALDRSSARINRLVEDLLLYSRVGDPQNKLTQERVDLGRVAAEAIELLEIQAAGKQVAVRLVAGERPYETVGDHDELDRMCVNLISNAIKYSQAGGEVTVSLEERDGHVELHVADEGIGIAPDDQEHLFEEFFRSSDPAAKMEPGTGLGLPIVARILSRHGGTVAVASKLGEGSTFVVRLPAS
jgi:signal transduction histidine kinase